MLALLLVAGCASSSGGGAPSPLSRIHGSPDLAGLLAQPAASPSVCPSNRNGTSTGRASPWVGTVDVSIYLKRADTPAQVRAVGATLRRDPLVARVYFESAHEAYREFQRLYTCWSQVRAGDLPASYRIVLVKGATIGERNTLVARLQRDPAVTLVACDPSAPCVAVVRSVDPSLTAEPSPVRPPRSRRR